MDIGEELFLAFLEAGEFFGDALLDVEFEGFGSGAVSLEMDVNSSIGEMRGDGPLRRLVGCR